MEKLDFILWLVLYPLSFAVTNYIYVQIRYELSFKPMSERMWDITNFINLIIWTSIAILIYN